MTAQYMLRVTIVTAFAAICCGLAFLFTEWSILHTLTFILVPLAVVCVFITFILNTLKPDDDS
jgi:hypothetical protein